MKHDFKIIHTQTLIPVDDEKIEKIINKPCYMIYRYEVLLEIAETTFPLNVKRIYSLKCRINDAYQSLRNYHGNHSRSPRRRKRNR